MRISLEEKVGKGATLQEESAIISDPKKAPTLLLVFMAGLKKGGTIIEYYINERKNGAGGGIIDGRDLRKDFEADNRYYRFRKNPRYGPHAYGGGDTHFTQFISEHKSNVSKNRDYTISMHRHFQQWGWDGGVGGGWNSHLYQVFGTENFNGRWGKINCTVR